MAGKPRSSQQALYLALNGHNAVGAPHYAAMAGHNIHDDVKEFYTDLPGYEEIFGSLNGSRCDHDWSLLSPAAYYADLLRLIETHISAPAGLSLRDRRADLFDAIKLDPEQTNTETPYLQLVNQILLASLAKLDGFPSGLPAEQIGAEFRQQLAIQPTGGHLPYNRTLEEIRAYLLHLGTDLATVMRTVSNSPWSPGEARERLQLSHEEFATLTNWDSSASQQSALFGVPRARLSDLSDPQWLMNRLGITRTELAELIALFAGNGFVTRLPENFQGLRLAVANSEALAPTPASPTGERLSLSNAAFLFRFVHLARKLNWSFAELNWALTCFNSDEITPEALTYLAKVKTLQDRTGVALEELTCFWQDMMVAATNPYAVTNPNSGLREMPAKAPGDLFRRIFQRNLEEIKLLVPDTPGKGLTYVVFDARALDEKENRILQSWLLASLDVNDIELAQMIEYLEASGNLTDTIQDLVEYGYLDKSYRNRSGVLLSTSNLTALYRLVRLSQLLGRSVAETLRLLSIRDRPVTLQPDDLLEILDLNGWLTHAGLSVEQLAYLTWGDLWSYDGDLDPEHRPAALAQAVSERVDFKQMPALPQLLALLAEVADEDEALRAASERDLLLALFQNAPEDVEDIFVNLINSPPDPSEAQLAFDVESMWSVIDQLVKETQQILSQITQTLAHVLAAPVTQVERAVSLLNLSLDTPVLASLYYYRFSVPLGSYEATFAESELLPDSLRAELSRHGLPLPDDAQIAPLEHGDGWQIVDGSQESVYQLMRGSQWQMLDVYQFPAALAPLIGSQFEPIWSLVYVIVGYLPTLVALTNALELTEDEFQTLIEHPSWFDALKGGHDRFRYEAERGRSFRIDGIRNLQRFVQFRHEWKDSKNGLLALFAAVDEGLADGGLPSAEQVAEQLAALTGWAVEYLKTIMTPGQRDDGPELEEVWGSLGGDKIEPLMWLKARHDLARQLGLGPSLLDDLSRIAARRYAEQDGELDRLAAGLLARIRSTVDEAQWPDVQHKLAEPHDAKLRDILVARLLEQLNQNEIVTRHFGSMTQPGDLSNFLLIDLENSGCDTISPLKLGLNSLQLYIHRCRNQLEPGIRCTIPAKEWAWMSHYRVWEANRKVYFYPENYLDPALRKRKTPEFAELQDELLQGEITDEAVVKAYSNYFDKVEALAKLQIVNSYYAKVDILSEERSENRLYLFARSHTSPPVYYFRYALLADDREDSDSTGPSIIGWQPWQRLELTINAPTLNAIYAFDKLFIFWVEQTTETNTISVGGDSMQEKIIKATVKYSFQNVSGRWVHPQTVSSLADLEIHADLGNVQATIDRLNDEISRRYDELVDEVDMIPVSFQIVGNQIIPQLIEGSFGLADFRSHYIESAEQSDPGAWLVEQVAANIRQSAIGIQYEQLKRTMMFGNSPEIDQVARQALDGSIGNAIRKAKNDMLPLVEEQNRLKDVVAERPDFEIESKPDKPIWTSVFLAAIPGTTEESERILIVYGQRSDLRWADDAQSLNTLRLPFQHTALLDTNLQDRNRNVLIGLSASAYWASFAGTHTMEMGQKSSIVEPAAGKSHGNLLTIKDPAAAVIPVGNQPGWSILSTGTEEFLVIPQGPGAQCGRVSETIQVTQDGGEQQMSVTSSAFLFFETHTTYQISDVLKLDYQGASTVVPEQYSLIRLNTTAIDDLSRRMLTGGVDHLLMTSAQKTEEMELGPRYQPVDGLVVHAQSQQVDFQGAFGIYFWEIFYHIPFLVAGALNTNRQFEAAQKWYQKIYDPTSRASRLLLNCPLDEGPDAAVIHDMVTAQQWENDIESWAWQSDFPGDGERWTVTANHQWFADNLLATNGQNKPFTIEAWHRVSQGEQGTLLLGDLRLDVYVDSGLVRAYWAPESSDAYVILNLLAVDQPIAPDQWVHIALTFDGRTYRLYLNRNNVAQAVPDLSLGYGASPAIASIQGVGALADIKLWDCALSQDELIASGAGHAGDRFWQFLPFRNRRLEPLLAAIQSPQAITEYEEDPFDPDAIATMRFGAYEKTIVMRYIDNLLDWGDSLFAQDSWEALTEATMLYVLASDLLGSRPQAGGAAQARTSLTYDEFNQAGTDSVAHYLAGLDQALDIPAGEHQGYQPFQPADLGYFCMMENDEFVQYWDRVDDRLFKLRHCLNLQGKERRLALFQPPIDPRQLIRALASGQSLDAALAGLDVDLPHYRFGVMLQQAKSVTASLTQLGGALLAALEKKDSAALMRLRSTHERAILKLTSQLRTKAVDEAADNLDALQVSRDSAALRRDTYKRFYENRLNAQEKTNQKLMDAALEALEAARGVRIAAVAAHLIPTIYGMSDGGFQPGSSVSEAASLSDAFGGIRSHRAGMAATSGQFQRRAEEWALQQRLAEHDVEQLDLHLDAARIRQAVAEQTLTIHAKRIEQANELEEFLQRRFGNEELYGWMVKRLGAIYDDTYQLALQQARAAEACYRFERNTDATSFIQPGYSNTQTMHLLAGEELMAALNHMEAAYREDNVRALEIEKTISLRQGAPEALQQLIEEGACAFSLTEALFDRDFPGHYCRKIVSVAISIPAIVGPYQNVQASLIQQKSYIVLTPDMATVSYLLSADSSNSFSAKERPSTQQLRSFLQAEQQIALSKGMNDAGLFELNFHDERYLPFEGTGVVSDWELRMPKANNRFDYDSISDVIIHLRYTALDGGDTLRASVDKHARVQASHATP